VPDVETELPPLAVTVLPAWEVGTPGVLCTARGHAIPISTALRAGDERIVFALAQRRQTLEELRKDARASLCMLAAGAAFTAYGVVEIVREQLAVAPHVVGLALAVERVEDHLADGRTEMISGARWRARTSRMVADDLAIVDELIKLSA